VVDLVHEPGKLLRAENVLQLLFNIKLNTNVVEENKKITFQMGKENNTNQAYIKRRFN
jgi:hypothetical protein